MRSFVIFLVLAISVVIFGEASNAQTAKDVTYVLIDKSGSMDLTSKKHTVDVELSRIISEATEGSEISITHFGSSNGGDCKSVVEVSPLTTVQPNLVLPYAPDPRGGTPLVAALDAVFEKVKGQSATIQIITDGSASCGKEDVCSTASNFLSQNPEVTMVFRLVEATPQDEDQLTCVFGDHRSVPAKSLVFSDGVGQPKLNLIVLFLVAISALAVGSLCIVALSFNTRYQKEVRDAAEKEIVPKKLNNRERVIAIISAFAILTSVAAIYVWFRQDYPPVIEFVWWLANTPFGSMLAPPIFAGFIGWWLIQAWQGIDARREKIWKDQFKAQQDLIAQQASARQRAEVDSLRNEISSKRERQEEIEAASLDRGRSIMSAEEQEALDHLVSVIRATRDRIDESLAGVESADRLKAYTRSPFNYFAKFGQNLAQDKLIDELQLKDLKELFETWRQCLNFFPPVRAEHSTKIAAFDPETLRFKSASPAST